MSVLWLTDIHLNFLTEGDVSEFCAKLSASSPDALIITGDIAEADSLVKYLRRLAGAVDCRIYYVLGNHDFYRGSVRAVREEVSHLARELPSLVYLAHSGVHQLTGESCVVGHDGWPDGRAGNFSSSGVLLSDFLLIRDFRRPAETVIRQDPAVKTHWLAIMQRLEDEAVAHLDARISEAVRQYSNVIVATHVPPYKEASHYMGRMSSDAFLPFMVCAACGELLTKYARAYRKTTFTVLCGHTHGTARYVPLPNLIVLVGGATYGSPIIQDAWSLDLD